MKRRECIASDRLHLDRSRAYFPFQLVFRHVTIALWYKKHRSGMEISNPTRQERGFPR